MLGLTTRRAIVGGLIVTGLGATYFRWGRQKDLQSYLVEHQDKTAKLIADSLSPSKAREFRRTLVRETFSEKSTPFTFDDNPFSRSNKKYAIEHTVAGTIEWLDSLGADPKERRELMPQILTLYACGHTLLTQNHLEQEFARHVKRQGLISQKRGESSDAFARRTLRGLSKIGRGLDKVSEEVYLSFCKEFFASPEKAGQHVSQGRAQTIYKLWKQGMPLDCLQWHTVFGEHISSEHPCHIMHSSPESFEQRKIFFENIVKGALRNINAYRQDPEFAKAVEEYQVIKMRPPGGDGLLFLDDGSNIDTATGETLFKSESLQKASKETDVEVCGWSIICDVGRPPNQLITPGKILTAHHQALQEGKSQVWLAHFFNPTTNANISPQLLDRLVAQKLKASQKPVAKKVQDHKIIKLNGTISESVVKYYGRGASMNDYNAILKRSIEEGFIPKNKTHKNIPSSVKQLAVPLELHERLSN